MSEQNNKKNESSECIEHDKSVQANLEVTYSESSNEIESFGTHDAEKFHENTFLQSCSQIYSSYATPFMKESATFLLRYSKDRMKCIPFMYQIFIGTTLTALILNDITRPIRLIIWAIHSSLQFCIGVVGFALSIGLGLGFATHVYETLDSHALSRMQQYQANQNEERGKKKSLHKQSSRISKSRYSPVNNKEYTEGLEDPESYEYFNYHHLMTKSGYPQPESLEGSVQRGDSTSSSYALRGQLIPCSSLPLSIDYNTIGMRGPTAMQHMWPNLPKEINEQFGILIDLIIRDYVVSWVGSVDAAIKYKDPSIANENDNAGATTDEAQSGSANTSHRSETQICKDDSNIKDNTKSPSRSMEQVMITSAAQLKQSPFINTINSALAHLIGQLCTTAADNVNVVDLILIKIVKAVTKTLKFYRRARKVAILQQSSYRRSINKTYAEKKKKEETKDNNDQKFLEIAIIKELLITKRLHKAIVFGLDVSSLLFSDPKGDKALLNANKKSSKIHEPHLNVSDDFSILHDRLFNTPLIQECELDYNRVLANRICRKLVPATDLSSPIMKSFAVEVVAGSILSTIMSFFVPESINEYMVRGFSTYLDQAEESLSTESIHKQTDNDKEDNNFVENDKSKSDFDFDTLMNDDKTTRDLDDSDQETDTLARNSSSKMAIEQQNATFNIYNSQEKKDRNGREKIDEVKNNDEAIETDKKIDLNAQLESVHENQSVITDERIDANKNHPNHMGNNNDFFFDENEKHLKSEEQIDAFHIDIENGHGDLDQENERLDDDDNLAGTDYSIMEDENEEFVSNETDHDLSSEFNIDEVPLDTPKKSQPNQRMQSLQEKKVLDESDEYNAHDMLPLLTLAVMDVQNYVQARSKNEEKETNWENKDCKAAVCHLVLVIEAAIQHGRKSITKSRNILLEESPNKVKELTLGTSLIDFLMDMTMNIDAFDKSMIEKNDFNDENLEQEIDLVRPKKASQELFKHESSTLRTMIVAWMQTGDIYNAIRVFTSSKILRTHFYKASAVFSNDELSEAFRNQLKLLNGVDILVDTMAVLEADCIDIQNLAGNTLSSSPKVMSTSQSGGLQRKSEHNTTNENSFIKQAASFGQTQLPGQNQITMLASNVKANMRNNRNRLSRWVGVTNNLSHNKNGPTENVNVRKQKSKIEYHLNFQRNNLFADKLRLERIKRYEAWKKAKLSFAMTSSGEYKIIEMVCSNKSRKKHRDLHYFSRVMYGSTLSLSIDEEDNKCHSCNILAETRSGRRMIEVPDDDSSFLLKAQTRPLKPLHFHQDAQDPQNSFKVYSMYYHEPVLHPLHRRYNGGRELRHCLLQYFPADRTALVNPSSTFFTLYKKGGAKETSLMRKYRALLSEKMQKERNLCQKSLQRTLMGNLMEPTDFSSTPRSGKAIDFVYRLSLFERPVIDVLGKKFVVQDGTSKGNHRADASSLELSDASLSTAIMICSDNMFVEDLGDPIEKTSLELPVVSNNGEKDNTITSKDHATLSGNDVLSVTIKVVNSGAQGKELIKRFSPSFIRAALLLTSARQEAQRQCLLWSVKVGSARQATRGRTEGLLQPTLSLLEFANSKGRDKESILIRNLEFGSSHVDKETLRRLKILHPRYPTFLRGLTVKIEGWIQERSHKSDAVVFMYKIRCLALTEVGIFDDKSAERDIESTKQNDNPSDMNHDTSRKVYKEEWVVKRSFADFMTLHKHLKTQMSPAAASGIATPRFAVATAAVFAAGNSSNDSLRNRKGMLLSLAHAAKLGALGVTRKSIDRRKEILDEYLKHLLAPYNLLRRCSEVLQFLGADEPLEYDHDDGFIDAFGRSEIRRMKMDATLYPEIGSPAEVLNNARNERSQMKKKTSEYVEKHVDENTLNTKSNGIVHNKEKSQMTSVSSRRQKIDKKKIAQYALIKSKVNKVKLSEARGTIFEFVRFLFDLDNATFFRSRVVSVLRTMSLVVTSAHEFNKVLLQFHMKYINGKYLGSVIKSLYETIWPNGVFYTAAEPLSQEEKDTLKDRSKELLFEVFPDQVKTVLGNEISKEGLNILHEMLQNRIVVRSLGYMIMDMVWLEIFPEFSDFLSGTEALDNESNEV